MNTYTTSRAAPLRATGGFTMIDKALAELEEHGFQVFSTGIAGGSDGRYQVTIHHEETPDLTSYCFDVGFKDGRYLASPNQIASRLEAGLLAALCALLPTVEE